MLRIVLILSFRLADSSKPGLATALYEVSWKEHGVLWETTTTWTSLRRSHKSLQTIAHCNHEMYKKGREEWATASRGKNSFLESWDRETLIAENIKALRNASSYRMARASLTHLHWRMLCHQPTTPSYHQVLHAPTHLPCSRLRALSLCWQNLRIVVAVKSSSFARRPHRIALFTWRLFIALRREHCGATSSCSRLRSMPLPGAFETVQCHEEHRALLRLTSARACCVNQRLTASTRKDEGSVLGQLSGCHKASLLPFLPEYDLLLPQLQSVFEKHASMFVLHIEHFGIDVLKSRTDPGNCCTRKEQDNMLQHTGQHALLIVFTFAPCFLNTPACTCPCLRCQRKTLDLNPYSRRASEGTQMAGSSQRSREKT
ncbi:hypothetical protein MRB53_036861 [Persea americana]|nr:hypothetical protein MRB53_036861 [Persea americana]